MSDKKPDYSDPNYYTLSPAVRSALEAAPAPEQVPPPVAAEYHEIMADEMERSAEQWRAQAIKWVQERDAARAEVLDARRRWCAEVQALHLVRDALEAECNTARSALAERNDARECQEAAEARVRDLEGAIEGAPHMPWCRVSPCTCWKSRTLATPSTPAPAAEAPGPGLREAVSLAREVLDLDAKAKALYGSNWDVERTDALSDILTRMRDIAPPIARALLSALSAAAPPSAPPEPARGQDLTKLYYERWREALRAEGTLVRVLERMAHSPDHEMRNLRREVLGLASAPPEGDAGE